MITEDYVSYKVTRLLQEKGFDEVCFACYEYFVSGVTLYQGWLFEYKGYSVHNTNERVKCPTIQMALKWLREVHHLHITIFSSSQESWMYRITRPHQKLEDGEYGEDFYSYEQAAEAAIQYCLENLI